MRTSSSTAGSAIARRREVVALVVALGVHSVVALASALIPAARVPSALPAQSMVLDFEIVPDDPQTVAPPRAPDPPVPPTAGHAQARRGARPAILAPPFPTSTALVDLAVGDSQGSTSMRGETHETDDTTHRGDVDPTAIDPSAVARALVLGEVDGPIAAPQEGRSTAIPRLGEREAEERLTEHLRERAMSKAYVTRRRPIHLTPRPDGSFHYDGPAFDADILPDGSVAFRDRDDATIDPPRLGQTEALRDVTGAQLDPPVFRDPPIAGISIGGALDGDSVLSRARGEDPHRFERERFMEETQELRERLEDAARARDLARARRGRRDAGPPD